jgi:hypothetical protein
VLKVVHAFGTREQAGNANKSLQLKTKQLEQERPTGQYILADEYSKVEDIHNPLTSCEQCDNFQIGKIHTKMGEMVLRTLHMQVIHNIVNRN